jgi:signal transduction histidine kinase
MFGALSSLFGHGIVGGSMMSIGDRARNTADVASRILNGAPPRSLRVPPQSQGEPIFDWRELQRSEIPESRLPPGSTVQFRGPSLWDEYRRTVLIAVGLLMFQSLLIAWLLYERRARQHAEIESRRNLTLAADANRRETISALTAAIGHELRQPLSSIVCNAQALQSMASLANQGCRVETGAVQKVVAGTLESGRRSDLVELRRQRARLIRRLRQLSLAADFSDSWSTCSHGCVSANGATPMSTKARSSCASSCAKRR